MFCGQMQNRSKGSEEQANVGGLLVTMDLVTSGPGLLARTMSGFMALQWQGLG